MSKSAIYTVNTTPVTIQIGGSIPVGNIVRRFGQNIDVFNNAIVTKGCGFYKINVSVTFEGSAAGVATIQLYKDNVAVTGALASVTTTDATTYSVSFDAITRNYNCEPSALSIVVSGLSVDVTNIAITVEKE